MRRRRYFPWLLLPALAVVELLGHEVIHARVPDEGDWRDAAALVREGYRPGDLVVVAPRWATKARQALGHEVLPLRDQARADEAVYSRLWEVSFRGARAEEARGLSPDLEEPFGGVCVRRYPLTPSARVVFDFVEGLGQARVSSRGRGARPCRRAGPRWRCGSGDRFRWVGTETISDLDHRPRRCIWAHPLEEGQTLRIQFPQVPLGARIDGHTAVDYVPARHCGPVPVFLTVLIDGEEVTRIRHLDCDDWHPFSVPVPEGAGAVGTVAFEVTAPPGERRHFCFQAATREAP